MKILIDIPKKDYDKMCKGELVDTILVAIKEGKPLPNCYGDLVDRDAINERFDGIWDELHSYSNQPTYKELLDKLSMCIYTAEPIIKNNYEEMEEELWK